MDKVRVMPVNNVDVAVTEVNAVNQYRLFVEKVEVLEPFEKVFAKMMNVKKRYRIGLQLRVCECRSLSKRQYRQLTATIGR